MSDATGNVLDLPYVCNCGCGYVNSDMFVDYFRMAGKEPTDADDKLFSAARAIFQANKARKEDAAEAEQRVRAAHIRKRSKAYIKRSAYWAERSTKSR